MEPTRKKAIIFFSIVVISFLVDIFVPFLPIKIFAALSYFAFSIVVLVYSIKLIKLKDYGFGITFLVLSSLILLLFLLSFIVGFMIGLMQGFQAASITGNVVANAIK
ncbi:hypothetical protein K9M79_06475 [Candidatus Woesearchaeota archaeon]|nr:hypothetical protein [Candidatus Woesearchaeota archaeon]